MQIILDLKQVQDLDFLLPLLRRLEITFFTAPESLPATFQANGEKPPLSKHIGTLPSLNVAAFEQYLEKTRSEWERPIF